ncbi:tetratricopeptide repeat-containing sensor histidine kinase [Maribacter sp. HS]|uniref:tetratricopeptide repeat-containing sensor histidine kinase n=1 Tax=Maribacter sp. HS TaxID=3110480 RepID=UPI003A8852BB
MRSKSNYKYNFLLIALICLSYSTSFSQIDSVQFYKLKISELTGGPDFTEDNTAYIDNLNYLSYYSRLIEQDSMLVYSEKALELSLKNNYKQGELEALTNLATLFLYTGDTNKSIEYALQVIESPLLSTYPKTEMKVYNVQGQASFFKQDYPATYANFLHALSIAEKQNDLFFLFRMNMNLGTIFSKLENYNEALAYYDKALEVTQNLKDPTKDVMLLSNLAYLNIKLNNLDEAKIHLDKCLKLFESQTNKTWLAWTQYTLGYYNQAKNNFNTALDYYKKALVLHENFNDVKSKADIIYGIAGTYLSKDNLPLAEENILESIALYKASNHDSGLEQAYRILYQIKKQQNDVAESLKYLEMTEKLSYDNFKKKNTRNLTMLNARLNYEKETEELKAQSELALSQQRKYIKWALAALLTLIIIVFIILNANRREKILNKKLANQAKVLNENQKALKQINHNQDRLFSIVGHDLRSPIISLNEILGLYLEDPEGKEYFEKFAPQLKEDIEQVQFTMDNLLHWGKTQMQGSTVNIKSILVKEELDTILQLYRNEIKKKSIVVNNQVAANHSVFADLQQFNIIFRNLINNAIKFTPNNGMITISTKIKNKNLVIEVSDTGVGMTETDVQKLFSSSENFSSYGTNSEKGTGLGLRLVKAMVIKNNGEIMVKSEPNKGSQFIVELPIDIN